MWPRLLPRSGDSPFGPSIKSHFWKICQLLAINAHKMAPSTGQWLQVQVWDAPTKGLLWIPFRIKLKFPLGKSGISSLESTICTHSCDCTWTDHLTRRVGGCTLCCRRGRKKERSAPFFYILTYGLKWPYQPRRPPATRGRGRQRATAHTSKTTSSTPPVSRLRLSFWCWLRAVYGENLVTLR